ncbi:MAG: septum formation initiator family protein [Candidatus Andersenbacteria bacterium]
MNILRPKIVIGVALVITILLLVSLAQEMNRRLQVQREVQRLQQEVQALERDIIGLDNLNQYFRTDAYQERLAREKLNYQAPGEKVVLIPEKQQVSSADPDTGRAEERVSIPERWWRAFFVSSSKPRSSNS